jgi:HSP90 family molecular chaperone
MKLSLLSSPNSIETSEDFVTGDFGIDAEGLFVISTILRNDIYNDNELAPIREYICNAWDATSKQIRKMFL